MDDGVVGVRGDDVWDIVVHGGCGGYSHPRRWHSHPRWLHSQSRGHDEGSVVECWVSPQNRIDY